VDGNDAHNVLVSRLGSEPFAPKALSGSGKPFRYHLFFLHPDCNTKAKATPWHPKLEFRGEGGIIVLPPSVHNSGNRYVWASGRSPEELALPELPPSIVAALQSRVICNLPIVTTNSQPQFITTVSRSTQDFLAGKFASGPRWNEKLFRAACDLVAHEIPRADAEQYLLAGAKPWNAEEKENALRTIRSAYSEPRQPSRF
jgi:hypothetical protein